MLYPDSRAGADAAHENSQILHLRNDAYVDEGTSGRIQRGLLQELVQAKGTAAEIEDALVRHHLHLELRHDRVEPLLALFFGGDKAGFAQDAQMLGDVVWRDLQPFGYFVHAQLIVEKNVQHAHPGFLPEGLERGDAIERRHALVVSPETGRAQAGPEAVVLESIW